MAATMINTESLTNMASNILRELQLNDWTLFSVFQQPTSEALPPVGFASIDEIAPVWWIDFISPDSKPFRISITDKPGVTEGMLRNEITGKLRERTSGTN